MALHCMDLLVAMVVQSPTGDCAEDGAERQAGQELNSGGRRADGVVEAFFKAVEIVGEGPAKPLAADAKLDPAQQLR